MDWINFQPWICFLPLPAFAAHDEGADESTAQLLRIVGDDVPDFRLQKIDISCYKKIKWLFWLKLVGDNVLDYYM